MLGAVIGDGDTVVLRCVINRPQVFVYSERGKRGGSTYAPLFLTCFYHATGILSLPLMPPPPLFRCVDDRRMWHVSAGTTNWKSSRSDMELHPVSIHVIRHVAPAGDLQKGDIPASGAAPIRYGDVVEATTMMPGRTENLYVPWIYEMKHDSITWFIITRVGS